MKRFNGSYVAALKTLSGWSGHLHPELVHAFDEKSDDSMCIREKSLYTSGSQHFLPCDPIKKKASLLLTFFSPQVMASLWT